MARWRWYEPQQKLITIAQKWLHFYPWQTPNRLLKNLVKGWQCMQTLKSCSLHIPLLFRWQYFLQDSFNQFSFSYDSLFPLDPQGAAFAQMWITHPRLPETSGFPATNPSTHLIGTVSLRSGFISGLWWAKVKALPAISHLLLLLDVALSLAAVQPAHRAGQPFLQRVGRALGARRALDGVEGWLRLQVGHRIWLAPVVIGGNWICLCKKTVHAGDYTSPCPIS